MTKWPVQKPTHRTTQKHVDLHDATDIYKIYFCVFRVTVFKRAKDKTTRDKTQEE